MTRSREWRLFTVAEANAALPRLEPVLDRMTAAATRLVAAKGRHDEITAAMRANGHGAEALALQGEIEGLVGELQEVAAACEEVGVEVKDFERGLVDFPAAFQGRVVLLCYLRGEGEVRYWHEVDDGFAGRQPVTALDDETLGRDG